MKLGHALIAILLLVLIVALTGYLTALRAEQTKAIDTLRVRIDALESNIVATVSTLANTDLAIMNKVREEETRAGLQAALHTRVLIEEMGKKDYDKQVAKFIAELEAQRKQAEEAQKRAAQPPQQ